MKGREVKVKEEVRGERAGREEGRKEKRGREERRKGERKEREKKLAILWIWSIFVSHISNILKNSSHVNGNKVNGNQHYD